VSDTPVYQKRETRFGGWQRFVVGREGLSAKVCFPSTLLTILEALHLPIMEAEAKLEE
jgi:hypothetical protein